MSWRKIPMKFPGTCIICNQKIEAGKVGLWAKGVGVKHEGCAGTDQLLCMVCGGPAGCAECELRDSCDLENVSQTCICRACGDGEDAFGQYARAAGKRFPALAPRKAGERPQTKLI